MKILNPIAQSFYVNEESGIFITSIDLYFQSKDNNLPVTIQIRPIEQGLPTEKIYPFSEVVLNPYSINVSNDSSEPTRVNFESPVYLTGEKFHAIVILSNSNNYKVWISKLGESDVTSEGVVIYKQPVSGGLFKSQNASTWNESPYEDLKYTLYRAEFTNTTGNFNLYNPSLNIWNNQVPKLLNNPLNFSSRKIRVGLGTILNVSNLNLGNTIIQQNTNASGNYVGNAGIAKGSLNVVNSGIGYTPITGSYTYSNIPLITLTGHGRDATASITVSNGEISSASITNGGSGYSVGDIISINSLDSSSLGRNLQLSVTELDGVNELIIDNVQGNFKSDQTNILKYINSSNATVDLIDESSNTITIPSNAIIVENDGLHIIVNHKNHGMHAVENIVTLSKVSSDVKPTKLTASYDSSSTTQIPVDSTTNFATFENISVSATNPGYILIGNEIISYTGISNNYLTGITRGIDQTTSSSYSNETIVYKYELNGISLRRINTTHNLQDSNIPDPIDLDYYSIRIDTTSGNKTEQLPNGQVNRTLDVEFPALYANFSKTLGGNSVHSSQNIQYELAKPNIQTIILNGTSISAKLRTVSGTSVHGSEISFLDKGFVDIELNKNNNFDSPRLICSDINQDQFLTSLPGKKSLNLDLYLSTDSNTVSPVIDLDRVSMILSTNRVNSPIKDYIIDNRVDSLDSDPSSFVYVTNYIELEFPATSLKVLLSAYINNFSDIRVLYSIKNENDLGLVYYPFPGYSNLDSSNRIIDFSSSNGTPDRKTLKSDILKYESDELPFKEYEFTADYLPSFKYFSIKVICTSTNQAFPPRLKDFRAIALA